MLLKKLIKNHKMRKQREKVRKGLEAWYNIMMEMEASGDYSEEQLNNNALWFAEGCVQYANMFISGNEGS